MAKLALNQKATWEKALAADSSPWVVFGADASVPLFSDRLAGMAGLIDWRLHGQVSKLIATLEANAFSLFPVGKGAQNYLLFHFGPEANAKAVAERLRKLGAKEATLAESTFPKDFLPKLKQTLEKDGIHCRRLEPEV